NSSRKIVMIKRETPTKHFCIVGLKDKARAELEYRIRRKLSLGVSSTATDVTAVLDDLIMNNEIIVNKHATVVFLPNGKRKRLSDGNIDLVGRYMEFYFFIQAKWKIESSLLCIDEVRAMIQTVFKDVARILFGYMDRSLTSDREKIERFFKTFVPSFFALSPTMFDGINHEDSAMLVDNEETSTNISTDNIDGEPLNTEPISGMWIQVSKESRENIRAVVANAGNAKQKKNQRVISLEIIPLIAFSDFCK
ncbi:8876_t:CDS:2, partial [Gigaspora rosea]